MTLLAVLALPALPVSAAPEPDDKLTAALLTGPELPAGFTPQTDAIDDLFARIPAEIAACGTGAGLPSATVYREFVRGAADDELLVEILSAPGKQNARAAVAALRATLPKCAAFTRPAGELPMELKFAVSRSASVKIGDAATVVVFVMTVPSMKLTVNGRLLSVASGGKLVSLLLMTEKKPKSADLTAAARSAVTKAVAVSR
ncbi:MAG TPA: hypothetical protein VN408_34550 [Actinoplanes sp.]|nr:hypothetical protein [Actinoplanes sp.]